MKIDQKFSAKLQKRDTKGGWTYVIWPTSAKFFGTSGAVKVKGTVEGHPFASCFMPMGDGNQMLPIKSETRQAIKKDAGDTITVVLLERLGKTPTKKPAKTLKKT